MKKIITGMVLLLATTLSVFSQTKNITVSGRVMEDTKEPAIQSTVQLLSLPDSRCGQFQSGIFFLAPGKARKVCTKGFLYRIQNVVAAYAAFQRHSAKELGGVDAGE